MASARSDHRGRSLLSIMASVSALTGRMWSSGSGRDKAAIRRIFSKQKKTSPAGGPVSPGPVHRHVSDQGTHLLLPLQLPCLPLTVEIRVEVKLGWILTSSSPRVPVPLGGICG